MAAFRTLAFSPSRNASSRTGNSTLTGKAASCSTAACRTGQLSSATATSSGPTASGWPDRPSCSTRARRTDSSPVRSDAMAAWMSRAMPFPLLDSEDGDQPGQVLGLLGQVGGGLGHLLDGGQGVAGGLRDVLHVSHHP